MKAHNIFNAILWGGLFIAAGVLLILKELNVITFNVWDFWPVIFIVIGLNIIVDALFKQRK